MNRPLHSACSRAVPTLLGGEFVEILIRLPPQGLFMSWLSCLQWELMLTRFD